jgi:hypothetical protein
MFPPTGESAMADDLKNPGPEDGKRISINQDHEVVYWCMELDCTKAELMEAIKQVGLSADAVRAYFEGTRA